MYYILTGITFFNKSYPPKGVKLIFVHSVHNTVLQNQNFVYLMESSKYHCQVNFVLTCCKAVVQIGLKGLLMPEISTANSLTILIANTLELRIAGIVGTIGALVVAPRVVHIPKQALDYLEGGLTDKLVALPD